MRDGCKDIAMGERELGSARKESYALPSHLPLYDNTQVYDNDACFKG